MRGELLRRAAFRSLPLGIDAHTLLFLHHAGVKAMADAYYLHPEEPPAFDRDAKLMRRERQTLNESVLYDYGADRAVELSRLARWVIEQIDKRPRSARDVAGELAAAAGERPDGELLATVSEILADLLRRGFIVPAPVRKTPRPARGERVARSAG